MQSTMLTTMGYSFSHPLFGGVIMSGGYSFCKWRLIIAFHSRRA